MYEAGIWVIFWVDIFGQKIPNLHDPLIAARKKADIYNHLNPNNTILSTSHCAAMQSS